MRPEDARAFLEVHHTAVRGLGAKDYSPEVVDSWAPLPITDSDVESARENPEDELRLIAEIDGRVVGIGVLLAKTHQLRACYVAPEASRKGVGSALLRELERAARQQNLTVLEVDSSVNAKMFYVSHGYECGEHGEHMLNNGQRMACVKMRKTLVLQTS